MGIQCHSESLSSRVLRASLCVYYSVCECVRLTLQEKSLQLPRRLFLLLNVPNRSACARLTNDNDKRTPNRRSFDLCFRTPPFQAIWVHALGSRSFVLHKRRLTGQKQLLVLLLATMRFSLHSVSLGGAKGLVGNEQQESTLRGVQGQAALVFVVRVCGQTQ